MIPKRLFGQELHNSRSLKQQSDPDRWHFELVSPTTVRFFCRSLFDAATCEWDSLVAEFTLAALEACFKEFEQVDRAVIQEGICGLELSRTHREVMMQIRCADRTMLFGEVCIPEDVLRILQGARVVA